MKEKSQSSRGGEESNPSLGGLTPARVKSAGSKKPRNPKVKQRDPKADRARVDGFIAEIVQKMMSGQWLRGRSCDEMAAMHGVPVSTVRNWSSQASRIAWANSADSRREVQAIAIHRLEILAAKAEASKNYRAATQAFVAMGELAGVQAANRAMLQPEVVVTTETKATSGETSATTVSVYLPAEERDE